MQRLHGEPEPGNDVRYAASRVAVQQRTTLAALTDGQTEVAIIVCRAGSGKLLAVAAVPPQTREHEGH